MFLGNFERTLDSKERLTVPYQFRTTLSTQVFITKGLDSCLELRSKESFEKYAHKLMSLSNTKKDFRLITRHIFANSDNPFFDKLGRIKISRNLLNLVNIKNNLKIVGVGDRIEIWDPIIWKNYFEQTKSKLLDVSEKITNEDFKYEP